MHQSFTAVTVTARKCHTRQLHPEFFVAQLVSIPSAVNRLVLNTRIYQCGADHLVGALAAGDAYISVPVAIARVQPPDCSNSIVHGARCTVRVYHT